MTSRDFAYWLQGFFEISDSNNLTEKQIKVIKNHLNLVFKHEIDPSIDGGDKAKQKEYQDIHDGHVKPQIHNGGFNDSHGGVMRC